MKTYCYCSKCWKPINPPPSDENEIIFCRECAAELYQKIFDSDDQNKKKEAHLTEARWTSRAKYVGNGRRYLR